MLQAFFIYLVLLDLLEKAMMSFSFICEVVKPNHLGG